MKKILISILFSVILLSGCSMNDKIVEKDNGENNNNRIENTNNDNNSINDSNPDDSATNNNEGTNKTGASSNKLIEFVGTFCPHCRSAVPTLQKFYRENEGVNIELSVIDRKPFPGVVKLPQNYTNPKDISEYTNEQCGYVPSYVFLDKDGKVLDYRCGGSPSEALLEKYLLNNEGEEDTANDSTNEQANGTGNLENNDREMKDGKPVEVRIGDTVSVDYIGTFKDGKVFDTSIEEEAKKAELYSSKRKYEPLKFVVGNGDMIKCFENGVVGMKIGETKDISCNSEEAYGACREELMQVIKKEQLKAIEEQGGTIEVGLQITNSMKVGTITKIEGNDVTIDFNSPMCGKDLNFKVTVKDIQA